MISTQSLNPAFPFYFCVLEKSKSKILSYQVNDLFLAYVQMEMTFRAFGIFYVSGVCVFGKEIMLYKCSYGERINIKCFKHLKTFYSYLTFLTMVIGNEAMFTKISGLFIMQ